MTAFLASSGIWEPTSTSVSVTVVMGVAAIIATVITTRQLVRETKELMKAWTNLRKSKEEELTIKRKGTNKTVVLPKHYTPQAAQDLLDLLA